MILSCNNISKSFGTDVIIKSCSFNIEDHEKAAIVGINGAGKSTLLKIITGEEPADTGIVTLAKDKTLGYLAQQQDLQSDRSIYDELLSVKQYILDMESELRRIEAAMNSASGDELEALMNRYTNLNHEFEMNNGYAYKSEITGVLKGLGFAEEDFSLHVNTLSGGQKTRVSLGKLLLSKPDIIMLDEPTNHLDQPARRLVGDYLAGKQGFILVSHDRAFLDRCTDHILSINPSELQIQKGNFSSWQENKRRQDQFELSQSEKLKKEIGRLSGAARQASQWAGRVEREKYGSQSSGLRPDRGYLGHKSAKMMKRAKALENRRLDALREKEELLKNLEHTEDLRIRLLPFSGRRLAELKEVSIQYGNLTACKGVSFAIEPGDRIVLQGKNGSGKSSVLKLLLGEALSFSGQLTKDSRLNISYVSQDTSRLKGSLTEYAAARGLEESYLKAMLRKMGFSRGQLEKDCSDFSGGQKKKVLIAGSLCEAAHLYLWDEPLNDIDLFTRIQIEELLLAGKPTLVFVEHDEIFASKIATKAVNL